jgi:hypothetical protein
MILTISPSFSVDGSPSPADISAPSSKLITIDTATLAPFGSFQAGGLPP